MTSRRSVLFAEPVQTAIGTFGGTLKDVPAPNLGAVAIGAAVAPLRPLSVLQIWRCAIPKRLRAPRRLKMAARTVAKDL